MATTTEQPVITLEQYHALFEPPVRLLTPQELFDFEVETLVAKGVARYEHADPFRNRLPASLVLQSGEPDSGPFILVPPRPADFDLDHLMGLVKLDGITGLNYLNASDLTDRIEVPEGPYLMVGVEDGRASLNTEPRVSREPIRAEGRSAYTTWRGVVHVMLFPAVLRHHYLDLVGSRYGARHLPDLSLGVSRQPALGNHWAYGVYLRWGAPSCGSVTVP